MPQDGKEWRVFVVDDEALVATSLAMILNKKGFNATAFMLPTEALKFARAVTPDLLLTDVMMPVLSGIELAIQMREFCPNCKVLLFSGRATAGDLNSAAGALGHEFELLTKPMFPDDLISEMRRLLNA